MKKLLAGLFSALCCVTIQAADTYSIDPSHTAAVFAFQHFGFSTFHGKIPATSGTITFDSEHRSGSADITFDLHAIATGVPKLDEHLISSDFFNVEKFPTASFKASKLTFQDNAPTSLTGDLTIKGATKPVMLKIDSFKCAEHPMKGVPACGANATAEVKRSDFGLGKYAPAVSDTITLTIELEATKQ